MIHLQSIVLRRLLNGKMNTKLATGTGSSPLSVLILLQMVKFSFFLCLPHFPQFFMGHSLWHPSMTASGFTSSFAVQPFDHTATCYPVMSLWLIPCGHKNILKLCFFYSQVCISIYHCTICQCGTIFHYLCVSDASVAVWPFWGYHDLYGALVR